MYSYILLLIFSILSVQSFFYRNLKSSIESDTLIFELILNAEKSKIISHELYQNKDYLEEAKQLDREFLKNNLEKFSNHSYNPTIFSINESIQVAKVINFYDLISKNILHIYDIKYDIKVIDLDSYKDNSKLSFNKSSLESQIIFKIRGGSTLRSTPVPILKKPLKIQPSKMVKTGIHVSSVIIMLFTCLQIAILINNTSSRPIPGSKINRFKYLLEDVVGPISYRMNFFKIFSQIFSSKQALDTFLLTLKIHGIILNPITLFNLCLNLFFADIMSAKTISAWTSLFLLGIPALIAYFSFKNDDANVIFYTFFTGIIFDICLTWLNPSYYYKLFFLYLQFWYFLFFMSWSEVVAMFNNGDYLFHRISKILKYVRKMIKKLGKVWQGEYEIPNEIPESPLKIPYNQNVKPFQTPKIEMPLMDVHNRAVSKIGEKLPIIDADFIQNNDIKSLKEYPLNGFFEIQTIVDTIFTKPIKPRK